MTQEIAGISFKVSTSELEKGSKALNDLQQAASRTDQSVDELNSTFKQSEPAHKAAARSISELTQRQKETVVAVEAMNAKYKENASSLRDQILSIKKAGDASNQFAEILKRLNSQYESGRISGVHFAILENQIKKAVRETETGNTKVADSFARQIESIEKVSGSTAKLTAIRENLTQVYQKGNIDTERYQALLEDITNRTSGLSVAEKELSVLKDSFLRKMHEQVFLYGASKTEMLSYKAAQMGISKEAAPIITQMKKQEERTARLASEQKQAAQAARELAREQQLVAAAEAREVQTKENFIQALKNEADAIGKTKSELLQMKAAQLGVSQQAEPYLAKLKQQEQAYRNGAITLGQYRNAMRQLPMQMTDIVTSLASGMPIWLVMVQQGGQIKDSFGGVGNSFKAVLSLITPMRIAMLGLVGVTGSLAIAAYKGSKEFTEYNKQLILTGSYAGKTASQLDSLAKQLSGNGITQYRMAEALAKVVGSGAFSGNQVGIVADISAKMEKAVGQDIDKTIEHFKRLKDDPVKAVTELNNSLHFLTAKQYEQIAAAEAQGRTEKAAELATKAYAEAMNQRSMSIVDNLGTLERAWNWIENAATKGWDAMLGVGRNPGLALDRQTAFAELQQAQKQYNQLQKTLGYSKGYEGNNVNTKQDAERLANAEREVELKTQAYELIDKAWAADGLKVERERLARQDEERAIKNQELFNAKVRQGQTAAQRRNEEEKELNRLILENKRDAKEGRASLFTQEDIEAARRGIQERNKDKKVPKGSSFRPDLGTRHDEDLQKQLLALEAQTKVARDFSQTGDRIVSNERKQLMLTEAQFTILDRIVKKGERQLTTDEKSLLMRRESILSGQRELAVKGDALEKQNRENKLLEERAKRVAEIEDRIRALRGSAGLTDRQYQRNIALEKADSPEQKAKLEEFYREEDELRGNWRDGIKKGFAEFEEDATNTYGKVAQASQFAFVGMTNSLTDWAMTGKANFGDFGRSFARMVTDMLIKAAALKAMTAAFGGTSFGNFLGIKPGFARGGFTGAGDKYEPAGVVHKGEFVFTKEATSRLGITSLMSLMKSAEKGYASGGYVGNNHPMANVPVQRMYGMQGAGGVNVNLNLGGINVEAGQVQQQNTVSNMDLNSIERSLTNKIKQLLVSEGQEGGDLYKIVKAITGNRY
ncbi:phage tail tape measure protein [Providencia rettgeri]|uniref:phage tail tape measure protein n=1 Tax=Providencia rettgeri TaxID=587 RepID=UPI001B379CB2|nr:phage tail tape measure protein [Providencia rettgeri]ELR5204602.1 phage tail tape measure protein [Providencia rettgeri]MBQ0364930.1 phage tail tape measure protein [Providencia rettgeri]HEM7189113.1 phage tail tape measure protein [Providencia rettgeri]